MTIPKRWNAACFAPARKGITGGGDNLAWIRTNKQIRALSDGDGTLRIFPQGKAGDAESGGFLLDAA